MPARSALEIRPTRAAARAVRVVVAGVVALALVALAGCSLAPAREEGPPPDAYAFGSQEQSPPTNGAIYQAGFEVPLFENTVARRVGDVLVIRLVENTSASKSASTSTSKSTTAELPGPTIAGRPVTVNGTPILEAGIANDTSFEGKGSSTQSNRLTGDIAVTVVARSPNGTLRVRGEKWVTINQGREFVRVEGLVRQVDVLPDNTVFSTRVANASITYAGKGAVANANAPGLLARFFNSPLLPF